MHICKLLFSGAIALSLLSSVNSQTAIAQDTRNGIEPMAEQAISPDKALKDVADYYHNLSALKARFEMIDPNGGLSTGVFYFQRPDKMRFSFVTPTQQVITADNIWLSIQESPKAEANRYPVNSSPIGQFLKSNRRLDETPMLQSISVETNRVILNLNDPDEPDAGALRLIFSYPKISLIGWRLRDVQDQVTEIFISEHEIFDQLPNEIFFVNESEKEFN